MKNLFIKFIKLYQNTNGPWRGHCRHIPSCSNYSIEAIEKYGILKGIFLSIKRILSCNPFNNKIYDPINKK